MDYFTKDPAHIRYLVQEGRPFDGVVRTFYNVITGYVYFSEHMSDQKIPLTLEEFKKKTNKCYAILIPSEWRHLTRAYASEHRAPPKQVSEADYKLNHDTKASRNRYTTTEGITYFHTNEYMPANLANWFATIGEREFFHFVQPVMLDDQVIINMIKKASQSANADA